MKLSTGKIAFPIEFDNGNKDCIYFNPNDPNLFIRLKNFEENLQKRASEINDIELNAEGEPNSKDVIVIETFNKMQDLMCEEIDKAFGGEISSVVFKYCSPFAIVQGEYFILQFVNAIKPEIEKQIKKSNAELEKKMAKHLNKYKK